MAETKQFDYLIIGGGIAGTTTAETIRAKDEACSIAIVTKEAHPLYSRVLIPSYLKGRIKREQTFMRKASDMEAKRISYFPGETVAKIDTKEQVVRLASGASLHYEKLLIASGGRVRGLDLPGNEASHIFRLQTIDDADGISQALPEISRAVVIGGGFISLEFLEAFRLRNIPTTLVFPHARFFEKFVSAQGSAFLERNFEKHGIGLVPSESAAGFLKQDGRVAGVITVSGKTFPCDAVGIGIGIERELEFLKDSGVALGKTGVITNEYLETNIPGVYAAGDIAEFDDEIAGMRHALGNWNNAFMQGKTAGESMTGERAAFKNVAMYSISNLGLHIAAIGEVGPSYQSVVRSEGSYYEEFFLKGTKVVGAFLINQPRHQALIQRWVAGGYSIFGRDGLSDPTRPLESCT